MSYAITGQVGGLFSLDRDDQVFYATMLTLALPFVVGVVLTVRRLRDAGWPLWLVACFFAPMPINVVLFILLSLVPARSPVAHGSLGDVGDMPARPRAVRRPLSFGRAFAAILIPMPVAAAVSYFGTHVLRDYDWSLFVGLPFVLPMFSVVIYGFGREVTRGECLAPGGLWILLTLLVMIVTAFESLICIVMMLPIAAPIALLGTMIRVVAHFVSSARSVVYRAEARPRCSAMTPSADTPPLSPVSPA